MPPTETDVAARRQRPAANDAPEAAARRILLISPSYPPGAAPCGVGDYSKAVAEEWARQGDEVRVVCAGSNESEAPLQGVTAACRLPRWSLAEAWRLARSDEVRRADVVCMQYAPTLYGATHGFALLPLLLLGRKRPPIVVTFHSLTGAGLRSKLRAALLLLFADHAIAANEEVTSMIEHRAPRLAGKVTLIPIGANIPVTPIDDDERARLRRRLGAESPGSMVIGYFGLVYPGKGIEHLLRAMPDVLASHPAARLVLIGARPAESAAYARRLERIAAQLGVVDAITWTGFLPAAEASEALQAVDLLVLPFDGGVSLRRGSLMAGLSHGLPIVAPLSDAASDALQDGVNLAVVPAADPKALAQRINDLLREPAARDRLAAGAGKLADSFAWPAIARSQRLLFHRLAQP